MFFNLLAFCWRCQHSLHDFYFFGLIVPMLLWPLIALFISVYTENHQQVNVLAIRQVKQGTETTGFRIGFTLHSCQYVSS